jgi:phosphoketolase
MVNALSDNELRLMDAYWRAANYLSVGQIYLYDNPLLKQPLTKEHIKPRLLGHWGTTPGFNFRDYAVDVTAPGAVTAESTRVMGKPPPRDYRFTWCRTPTGEWKIKS